MCGRLSSKLQAEVIATLYRTTLFFEGHASSHNVAPRQDDGFLTTNRENKNLARHPAKLCK
jgi:hypothetical protein